MARSTLSVKVDTRAIAAALKGFERQVPYATAIILTRTVQAAQKDLRAKLADDFTLRTKRVPMGVRIERATKSHPVASVGSVDDYMAQQVEGGRKEGHVGISEREHVAVMGGQFVAVPVVGTRARKTVKHRVTRSNLPNALTVNPKARAFVAKIRTGEWGIFQRVKAARLPIRLIYNLKREVKYDKRWKLLDRTTKSAEKNFQEIARVELLKILADAQRRAARKG